MNEEKILETLINMGGTDQYNSAPFALVISKREWEECQRAAKRSDHAYSDATRALFKDGVADDITEEYRRRGRYIAQLYLLIQAENTYQLLQRPGASQAQQRTILAARVQFSEAQSTKQRVSLFGPRIKLRWDFLDNTHTGYYKLWSYVRPRRFASKELKASLAEGFADTLAQNGLTRAISLRKARRAIQKAPYTLRGVILPTQDTKTADTETAPEKVLITSLGLVVPLEHFPDDDTTETTEEHDPQEAVANNTITKKEDEENGDWALRVMVSAMTARAQNVRAPTALELVALRQHFQNEFATQTQRVAIDPEKDLLREQTLTEHLLGWLSEESKIALYAMYSSKRLRRFIRW